MSSDEFVLTQFQALQTYLRDYLETIRVNGMTKQRQTACEKLNKLSKQQFRELSTDVYDEMKRRVDQSNKMGGEIVPFLPVQSTFHPKRNQARQKLATLPEPRFKDLSCDVYYELRRRFPETKAIADKLSSSASSPFPPPSATLPTVPSPTTTTAAHLDMAKKPNTYATAVPKMTPLPPHAKTVSMAVVSQRSSAERPAVAAATAAATDSDNDMSLNFDSLDNLMADLGSMITTGKRDTHMPTPPPPLIIEPPSTPEANNNDSNNNNNNLPVDPPTIVWRASRDEISLLKTKHSEELQSLEQNYEQRVARLEEDHKKHIDQYEVRIQEMAAAISELNSRPAFDPQAEEQLKYQVEQNKKQGDKIALLELSERQGEEKIRLLTTQISEEKEKNEKLRGKEAELLAENEDLTGRGAELAEQLATVTQAKNNLIGEIQKHLRILVDEKNTIEMDRNEIQVENIALKEEIRNLKERIEALQTQIPAADSAKTEPVPAEKQEDTSEVSVTEELVFDGFEIKDLSNGFQELFRAVSSNNASDILYSMKAIVMTVRKHLDDAEEFEKTHTDMNQEMKAKVTTMQNEISEKLTNLVMFAKAHANGTNSPTDGLPLLEQMAASLANAVVKLMKTLSMSGHKRTDTGASEYDVQDLKNFLDQQTNVIVQAIQTMLLVLKGPLSPTDFLAAADSIVGSVTYLKNVAANELRKNPNMANADRVELSLRELVKSISHLLDVRQTIASNRPWPTNQVIAAVAFEIAKHTKKLVTTLG